MRLSWFKKKEEEIAYCFECKTTKVKYDFTYCNDCKMNERIHIYRLKIEKAVDDAWEKNRP